MSFDVFLTRFHDGDDGGGNAAVRVALAPHLVRVGNGDIWHLRTGDSQADVYGLDQPSGFMANHIGDAIWDLLVEAARVGRFVILPMSGPACVVDPDHVEDLPPDAREAAVVVQNGAQLLAAIEELGRH